MPTYLVTIPIYHSLLVSAPSADEALDIADGTPYIEWTSDDCQPSFDVLQQNQDINVCEV